MCAIHVRVARGHDDLAYLSLGAFASVLLGIALIPLRDFTTASNLTFPFLALTIALAELGGPRAALGTALVSALSLDFFLTRPYLQLVIEGKHDILAFLGLAACGLVAAAFSARRRSRIAALESERALLRLFHDSVSHLQEPGSIETVVARTVETARTSLAVSALVVRDAQDRIVAASRGAEQLGVPTQILRPDTLLSVAGATHSVPRVGLPLPEEGGRLPILIRQQQVGWLDVWGNGASASAEARHTLSDVGQLIGRLLAGRRSVKETTA